MNSFYEKKIECISKEELRKLQLTLFNKQLKRAAKTKAYKEKLPKSIHNLSDIQNIKFTSKLDMRESGIYDYLAIPNEKIARLNSTSGTTGEPIILYFSRKDINIIAKRAARNNFMAGIRKGDICQIIPPGNLFIGGWYFLDGCYKIGATILHTGPGNTERQINYLKKFNSKYCISTAGYFLYLLNSLTDEVRQNISLKGCIVGAEPTSEEAKKIVKEKYNIDLYDVYGLSEVGGPFAQDCIYHIGLHIPEDQIYCEIIDPDTGKLLPDGEYGELVVTPLQQDAMPLIRYRTRDITRIIPGQCPCGRTHRRIEPVTHRIDDMIIVNGVNIFPSQIEECIYNSLSFATQYLIRVKEKNNLKKLCIEIELPDDILNNSEKLHLVEKRLSKIFKAKITVSPKFKFLSSGTLPEIQGKAKPVVFN